MKSGKLKLPGRLDTIILIIILVITLRVVLNDADKHVLGTVLNPR